MQSQVLQRYAAQSTNVRIAKVDIDRNPQLTQRYDIQSIPTLLVVKNGQITARRTGLANERELAALVGQ